MSCIAFSFRGFRGWICGIPTVFRLPLSDGRRVFMEWQSYGGPTFYMDLDCVRIIYDWFDDPAICEALNWFIKRGYVA